MALKEVSGVFSRYFIVGFFLPSFFALMVLSQTLTSALLPDVYEDVGKQGRVLVVGGAALLLGLLLLGLNYPIVRLFEGYPLLAVDWLEGVAEALVRLQRRSFDRLATRKALAREEASPDEQRRGMSAWRALDWRFSDDRNRLLPTRFGNAIRASEDYSYGRWGLDSIAAWPRIEPLLNEQERELHANAKTDVAFFLNSALLSVAVGIVLVADAAAHAPLAARWWWLYVLAFVTAYVFYRFAVGAALRWGTEVRASIDLHRLELYERLGLRAPKSFTDERDTIAPTVNLLLLYATHPNDVLWRPELTAAVPSDASTRPQQSTIRS